MNPIALIGVFLLEFELMSLTCFHIENQDSVTFGRKDREVWMIVVFSGKEEKGFILSIDLSIKCLLYMLVTMLDAQDIVMCFGFSGSLPSRR